MAVQILPLSTAPPSQNAEGPLLLEESCNVWPGSGLTPPTTTVPYILTQTLGTPHSDFDGYLGFQFTTDANTPTIYALGRWKIAGNSQTHNLYLYKFVDGVGGDVQIATVVADLSTGTPGTYVYVNLTSPVTLEAGQTYYVISQEVSFADEWYTDDTTADTFQSGIGTIAGSVFSTGLGSMSGNVVPPGLYVPVNFKAAI